MFFCCCLSHAVRLLLDHAVRCVLKSESKLCFTTVKMLYTEPQYVVRWHVTDFLNDYINFSTYFSFWNFLTLRSLQICISWKILFFRKYFGYNNLELAKHSCVYMCSVYSVWEILDLWRTKGSLNRDLDLISSPKISQMCLTHLLKKKWANDFVFLLFSIGLVLTRAVQRFLRISEHLKSPKVEIYWKR